MAQSSKELMLSLQEILVKLDKLALMFPDGMKQISAELKDVVSAITTSQTEIQEISVTIKGLQLDSQCKCTGHIVLGSLCLTNAQGN